MVKFLNSRMSRARLLLITPEGDISQEFNLEEANVVIGRAPQSNVVIANADVSRLHAQIVNTPHGFFVSDMGSTNGTFLNGVPIKPKQMFELKSNDQVNLGRVSLLFQVVSDSLPSIDPNSTVRFKPNSAKTKLETVPTMEPQPVTTSFQNVSATEASFQHGYTTEQAFPAPEPVYVPALNIEFPQKASLNDEELNLANEIFGDLQPKTKGSSKAPLNWSSWGNTSLFSNKKVPTNAPSPNEISEEDLLKEVLGVPAMAPSNDNYPVLYQAKQTIPSPPTPEPKESKFSYQAFAQVVSSNPSPYTVDTESFYYPQAANEQDVHKFIPEKYAYDDLAKDNGRDPFADLNFRDNDSLLAKFSAHNPNKPPFNSNEIPRNASIDLISVLQKFALPIGLIVGAVIIALIVYFKNSGVFG